MSDDKCRRWRWRSLRRTPAASRGHLPWPPPRLHCLSPSVTGKFRSPTGNPRVLSAFSTRSQSQHSQVPVYCLECSPLLITPTLVSHPPIPVFSLIRQDNYSQNDAGSTNDKIHLHVEFQQSLAHHNITHH